MLRDITLGQYYPADSVIHKLDPRVKLFGTLIYIISLFVFKGLPAFILAAIFLVVLIKLSKVPFSYMVKGLKTMVRLIFLIIGTSLMTLTTTPNELTDGLEKALSPLKYIKVPVHEIAMMMSIALRFIPILIEETDKIMKAQMARGADFEHGNLIQKAKNMVPLLVPLFVSAFRRANDLAMAMEARCYRGGEGRTKMKPLHYQKRDRMAYLTLLVYLAAVIGLRILWINVLSGMAAGILPGAFPL